MGPQQRGPMLITITLGTILLTNIRQHSLVYNQKLSKISVAVKLGILKLVLLETLIQNSPFSITLKL